MSASLLVRGRVSGWTGLVTVPLPRWLLYRLIDGSCPTAPRVVHTDVHPALAGLPAPSLVDSSWLASGKGFCDTHPDVYARVQRMFDEEVSLRSSRWLPTTANGVSRPRN